MDTIPFVLVLISTITHAYWNYLVKSTGKPHITIALSKLVELIIFMGPAIYYLLTIDFHLHYLFLIAVSAIISFLNYAFLSNAYKYGELSLVYPISRSSILFLPVFAYFFIEEKINGTGVMAILLILMGTMLMNLGSTNRKEWYSIFRFLNNKGTLYALLSAMALAGYTLWDKISIGIMEPFLYYYMYNSIVAILYSVFAFRKFSKKEVRSTWTKDKLKIMQVGFFNTFTYVLILIALTSSKATYVGGLRQLSIVMGVFLAYRLLGEKLSAAKLIGILVSIIGGSLVYLAG